MLFLSKQNRDIKFLYLKTNFTLSYETDCQFFNNYQTQFISIRTYYQLNQYQKQKLSLKNPLFYMSDLPPLKSQSHNVSSHQLASGLTLVGKSLLSTIEWTGEFTKVQNMHYDELKAKEIALTKELQKKPVSYKQKILKGLSNFSKKICCLCHQEKASQNFILMSSCNHPFCFSCLNTYAISKIEDCQRVTCPHPGCNSEMKLSSSVYKYLPQKIKLMYLQSLIKNKEKKGNLKDKCLRCLEMQHSGQCKVTYNIQTIQDAFEFRKCRQCNTEAKMATGKRKVICQNCKFSFCYLCGENWPQNGSHICKQIQKIKQLEKQANQQQCCQIDCCETHEGCCACCECCESCQCCPGLQCLYFEECGNCLESCCYCEECSVGICVGNILLFFGRLILSVFILAFYFVLLIPMGLVLSLWILVGVSFGLVAFPCSKIEQCEGIGKIFAILCCPILMLPGIISGPIEVSRTFNTMIICGIQIWCTGLCSMWTSISPREICRDY